MILLNNEIIRNKIREIDRLVDCTWEELVEAYAQCSVTVLIESAKLPIDHDCQDWLFTEIGLPQYSYKKAGNISDKLRNGEIPELGSTTELSRRTLVAYYFFGEPPSYHLHYGLCIKHNGKLVIKSRWGEDGHLCRHPLDAVHLGYGNAVELYKLINPKHLPNN